MKLKRRIAVLVLAFILATVGSRMEIRIMQGIAIALVIIWLVDWLMGLVLTYLSEKKIRYLIQHNDFRLLGFMATKSDNPDIRYYESDKYKITYKPHLFSITIVDINTSAQKYVGICKTYTDLKDILRRIKNG